MAITYFYVAGEREVLYWDGHEERYGMVPTRTYYDANGQAGAWTGVPPDAVNPDTGHPIPADPPNDEGWAVSGSALFVLANTGASQLAEMQEQIDGLNLQMQMDAEQFQGQIDALQAESHAQNQEIGRLGVEVGYFRDLYEYLKSYFQTYTLAEWGQNPLPGLAIDMSSYSNSSFQYDTNYVLSFNTPSYQSQIDTLQGSLEDIQSLYDFYVDLFDYIKSFFTVIPSSEWDTNPLPGFSIDLRGLSTPLAVLSEYSPNRVLSHTYELPTYTRLDRDSLSDGAWSAVLSLFGDSERYGVDDGQGNISVMSFAALGSLTTLAPVKYIEVGAEIRSTSTIVNLVKSGQSVGLALYRGLTMTLITGELATVGYIFLSSAIIFEVISWLTGKGFQLLPILFPTPSPLPSPLPRPIEDLLKLREKIMDETTYIDPSSAVSLNAFISRDGTISSKMLLSNLRTSDGNLTIEKPEANPYSYGWFHTIDPERESVDVIGFVPPDAGLDRKVLLPNPDLRPMDVLPSRFSDFGGFNDDSLSTATAKAYLTYFPYPIVLIKRKILVLNPLGQPTYISHWEVARVKYEPYPLSVGGLHYVSFNQSSDALLERDLSNDLPLISSGREGYLL